MKPWQGVTVAAVCLALSGSSQTSHTQEKLTWTSTTKGQSHWSASHHHLALPVRVPKDIPGSKPLWKVSRPPSPLMRETT
jgi:hypothetical protein